MLFNRANDKDIAIEEYRKYVSWLYNSSNFENVILDIELAEEELIKIIGNDLYVRAETHYKSADYELETPTTAQLFNDRLVHILQLPIAIDSAFHNMLTNDVQHTSEGRKVVAGENEKMAWEWMLENDNRAILKKFHKAMDRLIQFLEDNENSLTEWKDSPQQAEIRSLFINTAADFDSGFPIDGSRHFFLVLVSFIKHIETKRLKPLLGKTLFDEIKLQLNEETLTERNQEILDDYIKPALRYLTMAQAIKMLSIQILPDGVYQNYISDRLTQKTKKPADTDIRREVSKFIEADGEDLLSDLEQHLIKITAEDLGEEFEITATTPRDYSETKHFRV